MTVGHLALIWLQTTPPTPTPAQFVTVETLFTAAGSTTAVFTVTSVLKVLIPQLSSRWFALIFSLVLTISGIGVRHERYGAVTLLVAVINAVLVYAAAVGVNNLTTAPPPHAGAESSGISRRSYRWWV